MIGRDFKIPQQIAELVAQELITTSRARDLELTEVVGVLQHLTGVYNGMSNIFYFQEFEIQVGNGLWLDGIARTLEKMSRLSLAIVPEVVAMLPADERNKVLVSRYSACAEEDLLPVNTLESAFDENAVKRFRCEIRMLADLELVHTYIRGGAYWLVGSKTGTIVLTEWHTLENGTPDRCAEMLRTIEHVIHLQQSLSSKLHPK